MILISGNKGISTSELVLFEYIINILLSIRNSKIHNMFDLSLLIEQYPSLNMNFVTVVKNIDKIINKILLNPVKIY